MAKNQASATGNKKIQTYVTLIVFVVLALSVASLLLAANTYLTGDSLAAGFFALIGLVALTLSLFILYQSRRQTSEMKIEIPKVMTTIGCTNTNCDAKTTREFQRGDYVYKELDTHCQKCGGKQMVTAIYKEVKEKEKNYNV